MLSSCSLETPSNSTVPNELVPITTTSVPIPDSHDPPYPPAGGEGIQIPNDPITDEEIDCDQAEDLCDVGAFACDDIADYCDIGPDDGSDIPDDWDWDQ